MEMNFERVASLMKDAGEKCAVAAGGFGGMADAMAGRSPSPAQAEELRQGGRQVIDAAAIASRQLRDCADAMDRLANIAWASLKDRDTNALSDASEE